MQEMFTPNRHLSVQRSVWIGAAWLVVFLLAWISNGASYLPMPWQVVAAFPDLWVRDGFGQHLWESFALNLQSVAIMFLVSYGLAVATVMPAFRPLAKLVISGRFNGFVGMPLVFMALLHDNHRVKVALLVYGMGVYAVMSLVQMVQAIPRELMDHSRTLRMGEWRVVWEVVMLGRFDEVIEILRNNIAMGFMMLPMVEGLFKYEGGVGAFMDSAAKHFGFDAVFCALFLVLGVGMAQDYLIGVFRRITCPYSDLGLERA